MSKYGVIFILLILAIWTPGRADIVYPARLEIVQTSDSTFEVFFVLPVIQGRILRAQPVLPAGSIVLGEPIISIDNFSKSTRWVIKSPELIGAQVGIDGLGGSQVDILLRIEWLNGRIIQTTLSPVRPFYIVPPPPSPAKIFSQGFTASIREGLSHGYLLLFLVLVSIQFTLKEYKKTLICIVLGASIGLALAANDMLLLPLDLIDSFLLLVCGGIALVRVAKGNWKIANHAGPMLMLIYAGLGASLITIETFQGFTVSDKFIWGLGGTSGLFVSACVMAGSGFLISRARKIRHSAGKKPLKVVWIILALVLVTASVVELSQYYTAIGVFFTLIAFLVIAPFMRVNLGLLSTALALGGILGFHYSLHDSLLFIPAFCLFVWGGSKYFDYSARGFVPLFLISAGISSAIIATHVVDAQSFPAAHLTGYFILYSLFILLVSSVENTFEIRADKPTLWVVYLVGVVLLYLADIRQTLLELWQETSSMGLIPLPALTFILIVVGIWLWPKKRRIHADMNVSVRSRFPAFCFLGLAVFMLPLWTINVTSPVSSPAQITDVQARSILARTLTQTYKAFNLKDEDELYNQLSAAVDESLIDQVYLDSRRRLNAGVREGAEVTVRDVELLTLATNDVAGNEQVFEASWIVVARVKHLQHVHHRRNKYVGDISLRQGESAWKIARINLTSEDRTIVPAGSL